MSGVVGRRRRGGDQAGAVARRRARLRPAQPDTGAGRNTARARAPGDEPERQVDGGDARGGDRGPGRPGGGRTVARDQRGQLLHERHVRSVGTGDGGQRRGAHGPPAPDASPARARCLVPAAPPDVRGRRPRAPTSAAAAGRQVQRDGDHKQQAHRGRRGLRTQAAGRRFRAHRPRHGRRQPGQRHTRHQAERHTRPEGRLRYARHDARSDGRIVGRCKSLRK